VDLGPKTGFNFEYKFTAKITGCISGEDKFVPSKEN
jgi:hypothetical protein